MSRGRALCGEVRGSHHCPQDGGPSAPSAGHLQLGGRSRGSPPPPAPARNRKDRSQKDTLPREAGCLIWKAGGVGAAQCWGQTGLSSDSWALWEEEKEGPGVGVEQGSSLLPQHTYQFRVRRGNRRGRARYEKAPISIQCCGLASSLVPREVTRVLCCCGCVPVPRSPLPLSWPDPSRLGVPGSCWLGPWRGLGGSTWPEGGPCLA